MSDTLSDLILSLVPEDGSSIGNGAMFALLEERVPGITREQYDAARDELIERGILGRGRGRGGSIYRADVAELSLEATEEPETKASGAKKPRKKASRKSGESAEVLSYRHADTRVNNPEVGMVHATTDPDGPPRVWKHDPHLSPELMFDIGRSYIENLIDDALASGDAETMRDALEELRRLQAPYLNWTGKAERTSFEVDTVSLHVHERIDPATILANAAKRLKGKDAAEQWRQPDLFAAPFENLPLRQALDFYQHEKGWANRLVAGDSLLVMNSLLTKESMSGKVQMIYIDPPYGIKYGSNFQPFTNKRKLADSDKDEDLNQEPEMIKAFRDTWELGIHSYLTYLRDRLMLARELLSDSGSVFVQISDENVHLVRGLLDEVFGIENFVSQISFSKTGSVTGSHLGKICDILLFYAKDKDRLKYRTLYEKKPEIDGEYSEDPLKSDGFRTTTTRPYDLMGKSWPCGANEHWKVPVEGLDRAAKAGRIIPKKTSLRLKKFATDFEYKVFHSVWLGFGGASNMQYVVETNTRIVERCILMTTDPSDLVLDITCGSGTTAFAAEKWGRRWITCDTSRIATTLAKQRLMTASFDYYALKYPHEGLKGGFDYETVPHITLKSIANNPDIDTIWDEEHPKIEAALAALNAALKGAPVRYRSPQGGRKGQWIDFSAPDSETVTLPSGEVAKVNELLEWEVPFDFPSDWPEAARAPFEAFHKARRQMQTRMDAAIAAHADQEVLYDKPRIDKSKLRITGPFTVEAVPAPVVKSLDEAAPPTEADESVARMGETARQAAWRDELLKSGVRAKGGAKLMLAELEPLPGTKFLHATGSLADTGERVVVSFGPEYAALEQRQVEEAINEAFKLMPQPKFLLFCAFTFDPEAAKDIDETNIPGMTLLKVQMNTDLLTEDLKKKRASNESFWLMGQPDVELRKRKDGLWEVEVHGFDYFDPRKGTVVSGGKKQIAMWELDTDYDNRSLMPRQVFFPMAGAKDGWNRLKKTIRAELDEDLLEAFHGTVSLPFEAGENRRIAVKIIDDRGIESLKIVGLEE
ncbi:site-specific DNA-methyltransferase [Jhaorihella thermophila]|uniref:site-specific DNA-methyltransferase (adenine-specific) n=1 Tax=Jhaorihella thermophila TaxID=488547 RepID=A0A1H5XPS9_9RHOB|nr:site-specific DNA-methyltransferase [Jhaorihella thermophila]SEG13370.1 adenine-specific DNA-methyltransferase [Jhaorihella thermophila]